jgi:hypothetical protein
LLKLASTAFSISAISLTACGSLPNSAMGSMKSGLLLSDAIFSSSLSIMDGADQR